MRHDHPRDCKPCFYGDEHAVLDYAPMTDNDLFNAIQSCAYRLGTTHGSRVTTSDYAALSRTLNSLSLIADDRYQAARRAGR